MADLSKVETPIRERISKAQEEALQVGAAGGSKPAAAYGRLGQVYQAFGFTEAAMTYYQWASRLDPNEFRWHYYLALLAGNNGENSLAEQQFKLALSTRPLDELTMVRLAETYRKTNQPDQAESLYRSILDRNPSSVIALQGVGKIELARQQFSLAADHFQQALTADPQAAYLHYPLAMAYRGMGQRDRAEAELNQHGPAAPSLKDPYLAEIEDLKTAKSDRWTKGSREMSAGDFGAAISTYRSLVEMDPQDALAKMYLGTALARAGMTEDALHELSEAVELAPGNGDAQYCLGVVLVRLSRDSDAIKHLQLAIKADPNLKEAHFQIANALMRSRRFADAAPEYKYAQDEDPKNGFAAVMQSMAFVRLGDYEKARSVLESAHLRTPSDADLSNALARILAAAPDNRFRDGARALQIMHELIAKEGAADLDQAATIAMALAESGQFEKAAQIQRSVIEAIRSEPGASRISILREDLDGYEHHRACRTPWRDDDPIFVPTPANSAQPAPATSAGPGIG
jgi:tetratricopeptide (TPR) repeat protein